MTTHSHLAGLARAKGIHRVLGFLLGLALVPLFAGAANADNLDPAWQKAREEWNAIGDKAAAGDKAAWKKLRGTMVWCM